MALLTPKQMEAVRRQQVKNILTKQAAGKTLTAREDRILSEASTDAPAGGENFVRTQDELAQKLSVSRKTIQNVMGRRDDYPRPRADGRHDVAAWLKFFADNHIAGADVEGAMEDRPVTVADWKSRELELKCDRLELENAKMAGELVMAKDVEAGISSLLAAARQALNNLPGRAGQKVLHLIDYHEAEEILQAEVDLVLRVLERCEFLKDAEGEAMPKDEAKPVEETTLPPKGKPRGRKAKTEPNKQAKKPRKKGAA